MKRFGMAMINEALGLFELKIFQILKIKKLTKNTVQAIQYKYKMEVELEDGKVEEMIIFSDLPIKNYLVYHKENIKFADENSKKNRDKEFPKSVVEPPKRSCPVCTY